MKSALQLIGFILLAQLAGIIGGLATASSVDLWYTTLTLPAISPPSWVFGPVWITLYTLMGIASFLVFKSVSKQRRQALGLYGAQLAVNALWPLLFFGIQQPGWGFINIVVLLALILMITKAFWHIDKRAGYLMLPYIAWVSFATYLNYAIWTLN